MSQVLWVYGTVAAVNGNDVPKDLADDSVKPPQLNGGPPEFSCFAQRRTNLLKQSYTMKEGCIGPWKHH